MHTLAHAHTHTYTYTHTHTYKNTLYSGVGVYTEVSDDDGVGGESRAFVGYDAVCVAVCVAACVAVCVAPCAAVCVAGSVVMYFVACVAV